MKCDDEIGIEHEVMCDICHKNVDDPTELGEIMKKSRIQVHYFCLLLSTYLPQQGEDTGGILGFLIKDIRTEAKNCESRICYYCEDRHASVKCHLCDKFYHSVCGMQNNCLFEFIDEFHSFCHEHHGIHHENPHTKEEGCIICLKLIGEYNPLTSITSICCELKSWVHRRCMKQYALSAGYYLHCLWCKSDTFRNDVKRMGVFVPDRDAMWERENGAFAELYQKYSKCDAEVCLCAHGRNFKGSNKWYIIVCNTCATSGVHIGCLPENENHDNYQCLVCLQILDGNKVLKENSILCKTGLGPSQSRSPDRSLYITKSLGFMSKSDLVFVEPSVAKSTSHKQKSNEEFRFEMQATSPRSSKDYKKTVDKISAPTDQESYNVRGFCRAYANNRTKIEYVLLNAKNIETKVENIEKLEFDDNLLRELNEQLNNECLLNENVIELSEEEDSDKSADQLLEKIMKTSKGNVPKPRLLPNALSTNRDRNIERASAFVLDDEDKSSNNSTLYRVSMCDERLEDVHKPLRGIGDECERHFSLEDKMQRYFSEYRMGSPESE